MTEYAVRLQNNTDTAERMRHADTLGVQVAGSLTGRAGVRPDGGGAVSVVDGSMDVTVTAFLAWVDGEASAAQAGYVLVLDADKTITLADGDAVQDRVDTIVGRVQHDAYDGSGSTLASVYAVQGTPGAGAPTLPDATVPLRDVTVPATASSGTGGLSSSNLGPDRRTYTSSLGGVLTVADSTERDALTPFDGMLVWNRSAAQHEWWDGSSWRWRGDGTNIRVQVDGDQRIEATQDETLNWDSATGVGTWDANGVTITEAGAHAISAAVQWEGASSGAYSLAILVNGAPVIRDSTQAYVANELSTNGASITLDLAAGDVVTAEVFQNTGNFRQAQGGQDTGCHMTVVKL